MQTNQTCLEQLTCSGRGRTNGSTVAFLDPFKHGWKSFNSVKHIRVRSFYETEIKNPKSGLSLGPWAGFHIPFQSTTSVHSSDDSALIKSKCSVDAQKINNTK